MMNSIRSTLAFLLMLAMGATVSFGQKKDGVVGGSGPMRSSLKPAPNSLASRPRRRLR